MRYGAPLTLLALAGCGDPIPPSLWADVSGVHQGSFFDYAFPPSVAGTMTLDIEQADSALSGTFAYGVTIGSGGQSEHLVGRGTIDGTVVKGVIPAISLDFSDAEDCENLVQDDSSLLGDYNVTHRRMTLRGYFRFSSEDCEYGGGHSIHMSLAHLR